MSMDTVKVETIASHYQKTFELAYEQWGERNKMFVYLVIVAGIGLLLLLQVPNADSMLIHGIAKILGISEAAEIEDLSKNFPFEILLSIILVSLYYLMQRLYSTNLSVMRYYKYLGGVELELREYLSLEDDRYSFSREGKFYWNKRPFMQSISKWIYIFVVAVILFPFIWLKLQADFQSQIILLTVVDGIICIMIFLYFLDYAISSLSLDVPVKAKWKQAVQPETAIKEKGEPLGEKPSPKKAKS